MIRPISNGPNITRKSPTIIDSAAAYAAEGDLETAEIYADGAADHGAAAADYGGAADQGGAYAEQTVDTSSLRC